VDQRMQAISVG